MYVGGLLTFVEIISMMDIKIPATDIRDAHIMTAQLRGLHIPDDILTVRVLISNFHQRSGHPIHSLSIDVQSVPRVSEFDHRVCFKCLLKEYSFDGDPQMDEAESWRDFLRGQLELDGGEVSGSSGAMVDQVQTCARDLEAFLDDL